MENIKKRIKVIFSQKEKLIQNLIILATMFLIFLLSLFLFWNQSNRPNNLYHSDFYLHFRLVMKSIVSGEKNSDLYSLVFLIMKFLLLYLKGYATKIFAIILSTVVILTIVYTKKLLQIINENISNEKAYLFAIILNFITPIFLHTINPYRTLGLFTPTVWHNPTYIFMKLFSIITLIVFFKFLINQNQKISFKYWMLLSALLLIVNWIKPNFIVAFAPALFCFYLIELFKSKGKTFKNNVFILSTIIPSILILAYQYYLLFGQQIDAANQNKIAIEFAYTLTKYSNNAIMSFVQSFSFILIVIIFNFKSMIKDKIFQICLGSFLFSLIQYLLFVETGWRKEHANFSWGIYFYTFLMFVVCFSYFYKNYIEQKKFIIKRKISLLNATYLVVGAVLFIAHIYYGFNYFYNLLLGMTFY